MYMFVVFMKITVPNIRSTKNTPKVVNLQLTDETSQTGQMAFPIFKVIMR